jgi:hypothetical protein
MERRQRVLILCQPSQVNRRWTKHFITEECIIAQASYSNRVRERIRILSNTVIGFLVRTPRSITGANRRLNLSVHRRGQKGGRQLNIEIPYCYTQL